MDQEKVNHEIAQFEKRIGELWPKVLKLEEQLPSLVSTSESVKAALNDIEVNMVSNLKDTTEKISKASEQIVEHYNDYYQKPDAKTRSKFELVAEHHQEIESFKTVIVELKKDIQDFKDFFGGNSTERPGVKTEYAAFIEKEKKDFADKKSEFLKTKETWDETYRTLSKKIEGLLPGATSTGLSKAYQDQNRKLRWPIWIWSGVFASTIVGMIWFSIHYYAETNDFYDSLRMIMTRLPFFVAAVWLAIFASKQQSQYKRLQQEYAYKETLSKSFEAYKREVDKLPDSENKTLLNEKLITAMVDMCGYNPSVTLENKSHNDKPPIPLIDKAMQILSREKIAQSKDS